MNRRLTLIVAVIVVFAVPARATVWWMIQVCQPVDVGQQVEIGITTYRARADIGPYPQQVAYTTARNLAQDGRESRDFNAASAAGIRLRLHTALPEPVTDPRDFAGLGVYGDTVRVVLDLEAVTRSPAPGPGYPSDTDYLVTKTVDCVLLNAKQGAGYRFVDVMVEGSEFYSVLARTYSLESVPQIQTHRNWSSGALKVLSLD